MSEQDDWQLLRDYSEQASEEAFGALVDRHVHWVYSAALRRVRDPHLAEDVVQTVFTLLAQKATRLSSATVLTGWLYRTTQLAAAGTLRAQRRRELRERQESMETAPSSESMWAEIEPHVEDALSRLGEKDRCAVILHYFEKKSFREIARALGTSEDAAQKRVSRALDKLRGLLSKVTSLASAAALAHLLTSHAVQAAPVGISATVTATALAQASTVAAGASPSLAYTLKLMAWTKTKFAVATVICTLAFLGVGTWGVLRYATGGGAAVNIEGAWEGNVGNTEEGLRIVTRFQRVDEGQFTGVFDSLDQGVKDIPVTEVKVRDRVMRLEFKPHFASFEGKVSPDGQSCSGVWMQMGKKLPLTLTRTNRSAVVTASIPDAALAKKQGSELQGYWKGSLNVGATRLRLAFKIVDGEKGQWTASLDSLDQGVRNIPVTSVVFNKPVLEMEIKGVGGYFEGKLDSTGTEIDGKWTQGGKGLDLVLLRGEPDMDAFDAGSLAYEKDSDLQGEWLGTMDVKGSRIRIVFQVAKLPNASFAVRMDSPDQGAKGIPASRVHKNEDFVRIEWAAMGASFEGQLKSGRLTGTWMQGPAKLPLELARKSSAK